jgi:predicted metal-dependent phosphoesterase TrpH
MYKIDLHTHSVASPDGGITADQYSDALITRKLDYIAVTDHNRISFAEELRKSLGDKIIVGEEIMTSSGEIIGLFLSEKIAPNMTPIDTIRAIKDQGGLVYIPHPLENFRHGLQIDVLEDIVDFIDIVEIGNGRTIFPSKYTQILVWSNLNRIVGAASSDAHGKLGLGNTYSLVPENPDKSNMVELLKKSTPVIKRPNLIALSYPKYNRLRKKFGW